jgi:uncharacterized protein (DUF1697 family)
MKTYIILLRGVMPFGKNKVPMADLRRELVQAGLKDVQTYIQTGNVIATSNLSQVKLEQQVHDTIKNMIDGNITVIARTSKQFNNILKSNPFQDIDTSKLYFSLLASHPDLEQLKTFFSINFSPDKVCVIEDVIYTLYATKLSDSKFTNNYFESKLKVKATTRNFNTMSKLVQLSTQAE